ncbi:MAG TPA: hypothetical protein DCM07_28730 [Planctomycetaceae bacterium]|uniref:hypothetical protein n=1 Tax=Gimesia sp. TaxID=2024833 RepID=UPI000C3F8A40|nr:hypothetical protein [Gimesia sp.]MAX36267.1 hypothetical protein [Gimesia sp.]HAH48753.1 hypothetical protein [Planctomycetaceae bacterium]HBL48243.1 hypothetical protein [Planctomycetaceae bacterium]
MKSESDPLAIPISIEAWFTDGRYRGKWRRPVGLLDLSEIICKGIHAIALTFGAILFVRNGLSTGINREKTRTTEWLCIDSNRDEKLRNQLKVT